MKIDQTSTKTERHYDIDGRGSTVDMAGGLLSFVPASALVTIVDGEVTRVQIFGPYVPGRSGYGHHGFIDLDPREPAEMRGAPALVTTLMELATGAVSPGSDRSRDVSEELTEVRTVLSRAESALTVLERTDRRGSPDPDTGDMIRELRATVARLKRWQRHGSKRLPGHARKTDR